MGVNRAVSGLLSFVLFVAGLVVLAAPASAETITTLSRTQWAYIDSAAPRASFVNPPGTAPVGAHPYANGVSHVSKSYVTFDITALRGTRFMSSFLSADETTVSDCTLPRGTEVWLTDPAKKPTWNTQPAELVKLGGPFINTDCPARNLTWTATPAIQSALDAGRGTVTFVLRLPEDQLADPRYARDYDPALRLHVTYDRPPIKPSGPTVNGNPCATKAIPVPHGSTRLEVAVSDPDDTFINGEFELWPVEHPEQLVTFANSGLTFTGIWADAERFLSDATTYAWRARGKDRFDNVGPWSQECRLRTDFVAPATIPAVTSPDYTDTFPGAGGTGIPGAFTFSAAGDRDITGFYYGEFDAITFVPADRPGGTATIRYVPTRSGPLSLTVRGVDDAGNRGPTTTYRFWVASNEPSVQCTPQQGFIGEPRQCVFSPRGSGTVTGYTYRLNNDPELTVPAGPDGTATVTVTPHDPEAFFGEVSARANLTGGYQTAPGRALLFVDSGEPVIDIPAEDMTVGVPGAFTVHSVLPGSVSLTYFWDGDGPVTVPLDPDGTATLLLAPHAFPFADLSAYTTTAAGQRSGRADITVFVQSNKPNITSAEYPESQTSGGVGIPGTFTFSSPVPGVVSYTYSFNSQAPTTVAAGPDGTASVVFTPTQTYVNLLEVTATLAGGVVSESRAYFFYVAYMYPRIACDNNGNSVQPGQVVHCTLSPVQANVASYGYVFNNGPETTVPAGSDGTAGIDVTIPADQPSGTYVFLRAWSTNASGVRSDDTTSSFFVFQAT